MRDEVLNWSVLNLFLRYHLTENEQVRMCGECLEFCCTYIGRSCYVRGLCAPCPTSDTGRSFYTGLQSCLDFDWFQFDQLIHTPRSVRFPWNSPARALRLNSNFDVWPHVQFQSTRKAGRAPDHVLSLACLVAKVRHDTRILKHNFVCEDAWGTPASTPLRGSNPRCSRLATWQSQTKSHEKNFVGNWWEIKSQRNWTCGVSRLSSCCWVRRSMSLGGPRIW